MRLPDPLVALANAIMDTVRRRVRTAVVGHVEAYDPATQSAQVLPLVGEQDDYDGDVRELPPVAVQNVPVVHYGSGKYGITFPLEAGDPVVLVMRHRSHEEVDNGAQPPITPQRSDRMAVDNAVAFPGFVPPATGQVTAHRRADAMVIYIDTTPLYIGDSTAAEALALASAVDARLNAIQNGFNTHTHTGVTTGPGVTGTPSTPISGTNDTGCDDVLVRS